LLCPALVGPALPRPAALLALQGPRRAHRRDPASLARTHPPSASPRRCGRGEKSLATIPCASPWGTPT